MKLYSGCSQWGYQNWRGTIYPENAETYDLLRYYSGLFNSVELNSTFYNGADPSALLRWKNKTGNGFRFCPKVPRTISHEKKLRKCEREADEFFAAVKVLGGKLGSMFLQLPNSFNEEDLKHLESFLSMVPSGMRLSIEPRTGALMNKEFIDELLNVLRIATTGLVITDSVETHGYINRLKLTSHTAFVRFTAYGHESDFTRINEWMIQLEKWQDKGLPEAYFFLHFPSEHNDISLVEYFREQVYKFTETKTEKRI